MLKEIETEHAIVFAVIFFLSLVAIQFGDPGPVLLSPSPRLHFYLKMFLFHDIVQSLLAFLVRICEIELFPVGPTPIYKIFAV